MLTYRGKRARAASSESSGTVLPRKISRLENITTSSDPVASPSRIIQRVSMGPTLNAIGTAGGTVMMVAGHYINNGCDIHSTADMDGHRQQLADATNSHLPLSQPLPPEIFYGRDDLVSDILVHISCTEQPRIAILGPGGMGKTSTALHLISHEAVIARYHDRRYYVGLDALSSAGALAQRISRVINAVAGPGESIVEAIHRTLKAAAPTLLLLDNFETVWEAETDHTAIRDLLRKLSDAPSAALMITMRAASPPLGIRWTISHNLPPLFPSPARDVFLAINTAFTNVYNDENDVLDELLRELDYVPLAIHLLAQISLGLSAAFVLKQWREQRTRLLSLDPLTQDKLESVEVSIALSVRSLDVARNPQAIQLLGMLCLLPDGLFQYEERLTIIAKAFPTPIVSDFFLLRKLALIHTSGNKLGVLSPIRHFILAHHPPDTQHVQCLYDIFWQLIDTYAPVGFGPDFIDAKEALGPELGNIVNLIEHAVRCHPGDRVLDVAIKTTWHLCRRGAFIDFQHKVFALVPAADPAVQARYWQVLGQISYIQNRFSEAKDNVTQARDRFLAIGNGRQAADCSYMLGDILRIQCRYSEATDIFTEARNQFLAHGSHAGVTQCLLGLGDVLCLQSRYPEASVALAEARDEFAKIGNRFDATRCLKGLGDIMLMQSKYTEASALLMEAWNDFLIIGSCLGAAECLRSLGQVLQAQGKYNEASAKLNKAQSEFTKSGFPLGAAQCLKCLGQILLAQGKCPDASSVLTAARSQFLRIGNRLGEAQSSKSLGKALIALGKRAEGDILLRQARDLFLEIGLTKEASRCCIK
ncbi:hypothetical protein HWV62_16578 [Athelia sp. TMB]|nr:hypothetical protein HWV62_16578 [Athelia sp. TMB]